jgi:hypothetical protein
VLGNTLEPGLSDCRQSPSQIPALAPAAHLPPKTFKSTPVAMGAGKPTICSPPKETHFHLLGALACPHGDFSDPNTGLNAPVCPKTSHHQDPSLGGDHNIWCVTEAQLPILQCPQPPFSLPDQAELRGTQTSTGSSPPLLPAPDALPWSMRAWAEGDLLPTLPTPYPLFHMKYIDGQMNGQMDRRMEGGG